jgi:hypothetical protein
MNSIDISKYTVDTKALTSTVPFNPIHDRPKVAQGTAANLYNKYVAV